MQGVYSIEDIKAKLTPIFQAEPVYKAIQFSSYATGEATDKSDIDIVIDSRGELIGIDFYGVLGDVSDALKISVDLIEVSQIKTGSPIYNEIFEKGVILYEKQG